MKKYIFFIFSVVILFYCCKQNDEQNTKSTQPISKSTSSINVSSVEDLYIENDSLTTHLLSELNKIVLDSRFTIEKSLIENRHVDNLKDTIITRTYANTSIKSYKTVSEEWIIEASIENNDFKLNDFVAVGVGKKVVEKSFGITINTALLKIGNLEQTSQFILKFENGYLKKVEYEGYLD